MRPNYLKRPTLPSFWYVYVISGTAMLVYAFVAYCVARITTIAFDMDETALWYYITVLSILGPSFMLVVNVTVAAVSFITETTQRKLAISIITCAWFLLVGLVALTS